MPIDAVATNVLTRALGTTPAASTPPLDALGSVASPNAAAMERFNAIMNPVSATPPVQPTVIDATAPLTQGVDPRPTLGQDILSHLKSAIDDMSDSWKGIAQGMSQLSASPTPSELLKFQVGMLEATTFSALGSKVVTSVEHNVDSLVRMS